MDKLIEAIKDISVIQWCLIVIMSSAKLRAFLVWVALILVWNQL